MKGSRGLSCRSGPKSHLDEVRARFAAHDAFQSHVLLLRSASAKAMLSAQSLLRDIIDRALGSSGCCRIRLDQSNERVQMGLRHGRFRTQGLLLNAWAKTTHDSGERTSARSGACECCGPSRRSCPGLCRQDCDGCRLPVN